MNKTELDEKMKNMLHECADDLHAPDTMKTRVDFALRSAQVKPRHRWGKRIAVLAAVAAIAVTGAFAAVIMIVLMKLFPPALTAVSAALRAIRGPISA